MKLTNKNASQAVRLYSVAASVCLILTCVIGLYSSFKSNASLFLIIFFSILLIGAFIKLFWNMKKWVDKEEYK